MGANNALLILASFLTLSIALKAAEEATCNSNSGSPQSCECREETMLPDDLSGIVGMHVIYTYANGWQYELYYKSETTMDYRVRAGPEAGRCVKDQQVQIQQLGKGEARYKVSWTEATGSSVSQALDLAKREIKTVIFFPHWVHEDASKTVHFQNDNLELTQAHRDKGPTYPIHVITETAHIYFMKECGPNDEKIIIYGSNLD